MFKSIIKFLIGFFTEDNGNSSNTRLNATLCITAGLIIALLATLKFYYAQPVVFWDAHIVVQPDFGYFAVITGLVAVIIGFAFGGKVGNKAFEQKITGTDQTTQPPTP